MMEKPLRFERMSGLNDEQLDELEDRVAGLLEAPWEKAEGRPRELTLREALVVTCGYLRQNIIEDVWADIFDVNQSTISRYVTLLTPLVENATEVDRPTEEDAAEATRGAIALVDGTLWPCWSWDGEVELWAGKYKTTGHGSLIVTNLQGHITFVSEPVTGNRHDMGKAEGISCREDPEKGRRGVRRQGIHWNRLHHYAYPQAAVSQAPAVGK
jgi:Helix-turn-helix of DDE superfamily endonuclease